ncbi:MAG: ATP-binding protein [Anaerolineae bacterium]
MNDGIVATVPLGIIILLAVILLLASIAAGWYAASARWQRRSVRQARANENRLHALLHALPFAALIVDASGEIVAHNDDAARLMAAFGRGDTIPLTIDAAVGRVIQLRQPESLELHLPGAERPYQVMIAPLEGGETAVTHALIHVQNTTLSSDRAQVYQQLISAIGHELRTPLTAVMGHVDIIGSCTIEEEALWRRSLSFVTAEVERLARLVEDLLHLSRLDLAVSHIAEEAISTLFDKAQEQNVTLILQAANTLPRVQADPDRIRQVFLNLIDNAIKYAPDSTVTIQLTPQDQVVRVAVQDTGPGIAIDELAHIFEPFQRGQQNHDVPGTGLGLTIVKSILDQHNAPINVDSQPGQGTQFAFSLPVAG